MKVHYLNDEHHPVMVRISHHFVFDPNNPYATPKHEYITLQPQESRTFEYDAPEGAIPYMKRWENRVVLLSYVLQEELRIADDKKKACASVDT